MAKRVNTRFLILLTSGVAILVVLLGGALLYRRFVNHNPQRYIDVAEHQIAARNYPDALVNLGKAIGITKGRTDLLVRYGEIKELTAGTDRDAIADARKVWGQAVAQDPTNRPALQHLMDSFLQELQVRPNPGVYPRLREYAGKLAAADPSDTRAKAYENVATLLQSAGGAATPPAVFNEAMKALQKQVAASPGDSDLLFYLSRAKLRVAQDLQKSGESDKAQDVINSMRSITDGAITAEPRNAAVQWRAWMIYNGLAELDKTDSATLTAQASAAIDAAHANVKPADSHFQEIETSTASVLFQQKKPAEGLALLREIYKKNPDDPVARLQLARYLGSQPASRQEAIDLLSKPIDPTTQSGIRAMFFRDYEAERNYQLSLLRVDAYAATTDPARQKLLLDQMQESYQSYINVAPADSVRALRLSAMIQQIKGQNIEAVATLHRALNTMQRNGQGDPDLLLQAGRLDLTVGQTGSAAKLFSQYANAYPSAVGPRLELVSLYLNSDNLDEAARVLTELDTLAPDSSDVTVRHIQLALAQKDAATAKTFYGKLPEKSAQERRLKAQTAMQMKDTGEAARLLEALHKENPADTRLSMALAQVYGQRDEKDKGLAVISDALRLAPGEPSLLVMQKQLQNATPEQLREFVNELNATSDPFSRELQAFQLAVGKEQFDEAAAHLTAADKLKPDSKIVHQDRFQLALIQRKFDAAAAEIPALAKLNADEADGLLFRVRLAIARNDPAGAVKYARELVSRRPDFAESYIMLGNALQQSGRLADALKEYTNALDRQSTNFEALKGASETAMALQQKETASNYIRKGAELFPNSVAFREMSLNWDLLYSNHPQTVVAERQKTLASSPNDPSAYASLAQAALQVARLDSDSDPAAAKQMLATARDTLEKGSAKWPDDARFAAALAESMQRSGDAAGGEKVLTDFAARPKAAQDPQSWRNLADFYGRTNQHDKYETALRKVVSMDSKAVDARQRLAAALTQDGKTDDALAMLKDSDDLNVVQQRIQIELRANRISDAEKEVKTALAASPNSPDLLNLLTSAYIDAGRFDAARDAARNALQANPKDDAALYYHALVELRRPGGDLNLAETDLQQLKARSPQNIAGRSALAEVDRRRNRPDDALHELEDVQQMIPLDRDARLNLLSAYASTDPPHWDQYDQLIADALANPRLKSDPVWLQRQAAGLTARRQYTAAVDRLKAALALAPGSAELESELMTTFLAAKDYRGTIQEADRLLSGGKSIWWALYFRGVAHAATDKAAGLADFDAAIASANSNKDAAAVQKVILAVGSNVGIDQAIERAKAQGPAVDWRLVIGELYQQKNDFAAVVQAAKGLQDDSSVTLTPAQKVATLRLLASGYQGLKQFDAAKAAYLKLLEVAPDDVVALNNLAFMLAEDLRDPQAAKPYIQHAYQLNQKGQGIGTIADTYGWVLTLAGGADAKKGIGVLQNLVDGSPQFIDARYHLGMALLRAKQPADARTQLQRALDQLTALQQTQPDYRPELKSLLVSALDQAKQGD